VSDRTDDGSGGLVQKGRHLLAVLRATPPVRTWQHYTDRRGNLLAGGVAYAGIFSVGASLVVGFTVLGALVGRDSQLNQSVIAAVDQQLPGLLDVGPDGGIVAPDELFATDFASWAGITALVVALYSGLRWLDGVRSGVRSIFDRPKDDTLLVLKKIKDAGILATLGLAIVLSAVLGVVVSSSAGWLLGLVGLQESAAGQVVLRVLAVLVVLLVDWAIFLVLFRLLARIDLPWHDLLSGALVGAIGVGLLKLFGGLLLGRAGGSNPLLAGSAVLVGLLLWMNLLSRVALLAAAWTATGHEPRPASAVAPGAVLALASSEGRAIRVRQQAEPTYGTRAADRTTLAAGAVLGALALTGASAVRDAARSVRDLLRSSPD
jgi:membrane protein